MNNNHIVAPNEVAITKSTDITSTLQVHEQNMMNFLEYCGLPTESILVTVDERKKVFKNITDVLEIINLEKRLSATYLSKFISACGAGLFDAALNYMWDETIKQLRIRISHYDIQYFYDLAVTNTEKRKKLDSVDDLIKLDDSELIKGARDIDLINDMGYRHLDYIKYMRNWASAAHPNQVDLSGLQLISWLETCIKEVISLPDSNVTVEIGRLLKNIKTTSIDKAEAEQIGLFFIDLPKEKANALVSGFFGYYTRHDSTEQTRHNINLLLPLIWDLVDEDIKNDFGIKHAKFSATGDKEQAKLARDFLELVDGAKYLTEQVRVAELQIAIENLRTAHYSSIDNFYKEPPVARQLQRLIGTNGNVPRQVEHNYVTTVVDAFLTNGLGVCWDAEAIYVEMIKSFSQRQAIIALFTYRDDSIVSKLYYGKCKSKFLELVDIIKPMISSPAIIEFAEVIKNYKNDFYNMRNDEKIKARETVLRAILK